MRYDPERHNRHSIRLPGFNYANAGAYFVTICCQDRKCIFGKIVDGKMILNEYGKIANDEWEKTMEIRPNVKLHEFVIMPNHVHGILEIAWVDMGVHGVGEKGVCDTPVRRGVEVANVLQSPSNTIGAIVRGYKSAVSKQIRDRRGVSHTPHTTAPPPNAANPIPNAATPNPPSIWQRNYWEHIIRNEMEFARIAEYIRNNPMVWQKKRLKMILNGETGWN